MFEKMLIKIETVSPLHVGSNATVATVDLPIQREKHTNFPVVFSSSLKGAFRDYFRKKIKISEDKEDKKLTNIIFGYDKADDYEKEENYENNDKKDNTLSSMVSFSDAKLLFLPIRSNIAPFVRVTSPFLIKRFIDDLNYLKNINNVDISFNLNDEKVYPIFNNKTIMEKIVFEDLILNYERNIDNEQNTNIFKEHLNNLSINIDNLFIVSDQVFKYCVENCTEIQTNIKIDSETGTAMDGSLRYQEFLPSDSILYSIITKTSDRKFNKNVHVFSIIKEKIDNFIQIGGDQSTGKGICKISYFENKEE